MANGNLPGFLRAGPKCLKFSLKDMIYCFKNYELLTQSETKKMENLFALYERASQDESDVKSVQSALSDLLTTSATHGTFSRPSTKPGTEYQCQGVVCTLLIIFSESVNPSTCLSVYLIITRLRNVNLLCFFRQYRGYRFS